MICSPTLMIARQESRDQPSGKVARFCRSRATTPSRADPGCVIERDGRGDFAADFLGGVERPGAEFLDDMQHAARAVLIAQRDQQIEHERVDAALEQVAEGLAFAFVLDIGVLEELQQVGILLEQLAEAEQFLLDAADDALGLRHLEEGAGITSIDGIVRHGGKSLIRRAGFC